LINDYFIVQADMGNIKIISVITFNQIQLVEYSQDSGKSAAVAAVVAV
jgi:hypothetical protein